LLGLEVASCRLAAAMAESRRWPSAQRRLVVFGITGDLAREDDVPLAVPLESRGLLDCPIVGVAVDDWTIEHLREHARRRSIAATGEHSTEVFARLAARLSYVQRRLRRPATYERVGKAIGEARAPVFYLEIPPSLFGTVVKGLAAPA
jgi:glucose-6-phosphate 1-dehydrogenase